MTPPYRSPCYKCNEKKKLAECVKACKKRQDYVDSFKGKDLLKAVDTEDSYRIMPM